MASFAGTIGILSRQSRPMIATLSFSSAAILTLALLPPPDALEGWTRLLLADVKGRSTSEHDGVQKDRQTELRHCGFSHRLCNDRTSDRTHLTSSPSLTPCVISRSMNATLTFFATTLTLLEGKKEKETKVHDSPPAHLSACLHRCKRNFTSLFVTLADDTATDGTLFPHTSPKPTPTGLEGRTRLLLADLSGGNTSEQCGVQKARRTKHRHIRRCCLSLTTHSLPLPSSSLSPPTPSHSLLPLSHHPHPPTPLLLSLATHTIPLPSSSLSPPTPSHSPLPLPHHPHPPTPFFLSLTTHTLPLPSASPSPPTPSLSPLPLPHHPHPPTPLCLSLTTHTLPLPSASPSPPTPSHSPLPLPHHPHPPTPLITLGVVHADGCSYKAQAMPLFLTIPSCLSFFKIEDTTWIFLIEMNTSQRGWIKTKGEERQILKTIHQMLRMEGIEDVMAEKLQNDKTGDYGRHIVAKSIEWNNQLGMNLQQPR
ncbi:hypothetical protein BLNAU_7508 [Blattamonas nauphoetae]|uniref:Uncharacterized protein n=1 Tax=Blattamonas nauphoetae TaxID=2049346 RepID=A0ABQ9Y1Q1_9EUKA|nr:hypothetical protein BLNAU_7508 [Blattamonas nauphoetae]